MEIRELYKKKQAILSGQARTPSGNIIKMLLIAAGYLLLSALLVGFRMQQLVLVFLCSALYLGSATTRKFILGFGVFVVYWIIFDYMKAFPNYRVNAVHIQDVYHLEKQLFGIRSEGMVLTPNEFWIKYQRPALDILSGCFYLCWVPVPLAFAVYLFFKNREEFLRFSLTFFLVNLIGFVIYYVFPSAPPWYLQQHGDTFYPLTPGSPAGLMRFDTQLHVSIFKSIYAQSSNVFAAMPSLHASYPLIVLYYGLRNKMGWMNGVFAMIAAGIWFAAVYTGHHYVLDVLAGIMCFAAGTLLFNRLARRGAFHRFFRSYVQLIRTST